MSTRINFIHCMPKRAGLHQLPQLFLEGATPLGIIMLTMLLLPAATTTTTPLEQLSHAGFFEDLRSRCLSIESKQNIRELKENFLTNERLKDPSLRQTLESAGLAHLLALSGSQTGPVSSFVCALVIALCIACLSRIRQRVNHSVILSIRACGLISQLAVLTCLVGLFQSTGALNKILSSKIMSLMLYPLRSSLGENRLQLLILDQKLTLALPWLVAFILGKNPVHDLSFLLSVLGAQTAHLVAFSITTIDWGENKTQTSEKLTAANRIIRALTPLVQWTLITALTSALMCLFCFQLWPVSNVSDKILANLLAGPLVLFHITPAALIVIACVALNFDTALVPANLILEAGLSVLIRIGESFSLDTSKNSLSNARFLRPGESIEWHMHPYLCLCLLILFLTSIEIYLKRLSVSKLR